MFKVFPYFPYLLVFSKNPRTYFDSSWPSQILILFTWHSWHTIPVDTFHWWKGALTFWPTTMTKKKVIETTWLAARQDTPAFTPRVRQMPLLKQQYAGAPKSDITMRHYLWRDLNILVWDADCWEEGCKRIEFPTREIFWQGEFFRQN